MAARSGKRRRSPVGGSWLPASLIVALLGGGYLAADIYDIAPGPLTNSQPWPEAEPFPSATLPTAVEQPPLLMDNAAPVPSKEAVGLLVENFLQDPNSGPRPGVLIIDAATGEVLGQSHPDEGRVPASTTKLLTAIAALDAVGADFRFTTEVARGSDADAHALTVIGGGDLTLAAGQGDSGAVIGHGGVHDLAVQVAEHLRSENTREVSDVVVDESLWEGDRLAPRWTQQDLNEGWVIPMSPLAIDLGRIQGRMPRSQNPGLDVGQALVEALEDLGVTVSGSVRTGRAPEAATVIATVSSAPLAQLVEYMLVYSDNVLADGIGRLVAVASGEEGSFAGTERAIISHLQGLGISTEGLRLADASGMSSINAISPRTLTDAMGVVTRDHPALLATVRGLPVAALEGTLRTRMQETAAAGMVAAKTGTLKTTATIAGQVHTASGRVLHVAILTNDLESSVEGARGAIDRLLVGLANCGCQ